MMPIHTITLTGTINQPNAEPAANVPVTFTLQRPDQDPESGLVVPRSFSAVTDEDGNFSVEIWPTALSPIGNAYEFLVGGLAPFQAFLLIPDLDPLDLEDDGVLTLATQPALPPILVRGPIGPQGVTGTTGPQGLQGR